MPGTTAIECAEAEERREVPTHPGYHVDATGRIRGPRGRIMRPMTQPKSGHLYVLVSNRRPRKLFVHRAVLLAFVGPPGHGQEGRHLDGQPRHNELGNLAWGTRQENSDDKQRHGRQPRGDRSPSAKLTPDQVAEIRLLRGSTTLRELAGRYGVSHTAIRRAAAGITWQGATGG